ncbi:MAG: hypothetical protein EAZ76_09175, partial [Nostocales cyanobacterium]
MVIDCGELICDGNAARMVAKDKLSNPDSWAVVRSELGLQSKATLKSVTIYNTNTVFFEVIASDNTYISDILKQDFIDKIEE